MIFRIMYSFLVLMTILFWPFWISLGMIFLGMILYKKYYEGLIGVFIFESLHSVNEVKIFGLYFVLLLIFVFLFILIEFSKKKLNTGSFS
jgi:hypothetical protein